jgi:hypothetical protein
MTLHTVKCVQHLINSDTIVQIDVATCIAKLI